MLLPAIQRLGTFLAVLFACVRLFAAGLIVGESLIGVAMAFVIAVSVTNGGSDAPLALGLKNWDTAASWLGLAGFLLGMTVFARRILKAAR